jgi:WD40 repeat protein
VVTVWDAITGREVRTLRGCADEIYKVAYSPDGKQLAASSGSRQNKMPGEVRIWDPDSGRELFTLRGHSEAVLGLAYSPDGSRLASSSGVHMGTEAKHPGEVKLWDTITGQELLTLRGAGSRILGVAFSPDGTSLAAACKGFAPRDGIILLWEGRPTYLAGRAGP